MWYVIDKLLQHSISFLVRRTVDMSLDRCPDNFWLCASARADVCNSSPSSSAADVFRVFCVDGRQNSVLRMNAEQTTHFSPTNTHDYTSVSKHSLESYQSTTFIFTLIIQLSLSPHHGCRYSYGNKGCRNDKDWRERIHLGRNIQASIAWWLLANYWQCQ